LDLGRVLGWIWAPRLDLGLVQWEPTNVGTTAGWIWAGDRVGLSWRSQREKTEVERGRGDEIGARAADRGQTDMNRREA
jgi:hypothetical protein